MRSRPRPAVAIPSTTVSDNLRTRTILAGMDCRHHLFDNVSSHWGVAWFDRLGAFGERGPESTGHHWGSSSVHTEANQWPVSVHAGVHEALSEAGPSGVEALKWSRCHRGEWPGSIISWDDVMRFADGLYNERTPENPILSREPERARAEIRVLGP